MSLTQAGRGDVSGYEVVHASREFRGLRRHLGSFVVPAVVLFLGWYFLYVLLVAFAPGAMRVTVAGQVNVGLCLGALQFVSTFATAVIYRHWARRRLDPQADRLRQRLETGRRR